MALKRKITKADFDKLSEEMQAEYRAEGAGYVLDVEGDDDNSALKRSKDREKQRADEATKKAEELEAELEDLRSGTGKKDKDVETLTKAHEKKMKETTESYEAKVSKLSSFAKNKLIDSTADSIAGKISTMPKLMAKAIKDRLTVDLDGDVPTLKILDSKGNPSDLTPEQLEQEFVANKEYSGILVGSKATGSGAGKGGLNSKGGAITPNPNENKANLAELSPQQLAERMKEVRGEAGQQ